MRIIAVGKKHENWIQEGIDRYEKRLKKPFNIEWTLIPHSSLQDSQARDKESDLILNKIPDDTFTILLDETGKNIDSPTLTQILNNNFNMSKKIVFIIGGAYGVNQKIINRADLVWSLSKLVFPHMLVRLILIEQIYRSQEIANGSNYHHI